jgi:tetratricopeptide (TPR) repeat protein
MNPACANPSSRTGNRKPSIRVWSSSFSLSLYRAALFAVIAFLFSLNLHAADTVSNFDAANKLYEQGKYADAVAAYDQLLKSGDAPAVYYNRGNALFKLNQLGRAIASYRMAQNLSPRDPDLRANLQSARSRARGGTPYHAERWRVWLEQLTLNEWTLITALAVWTLFLLLALAQWRPNLKSKLGGYITGAGVAALLLGLCLGIQLDAGYFTRSAIVITGEAEVRNGPLDEAPSVYKVRDGLELNILDEKDNWLQVRDPAQRVGWVRRDQVLVFEPDGASKAKS